MPATPPGSGTLKKPSTLRRRAFADAMAPGLTAVRLQTKPKGSNASFQSRASRRPSSADWL